MPTSKGQMIVLTPEGDKLEIDIKSAPGLGRLQKAVDGYIELVPLFDTWEQPDGTRVPCVALTNEEGKLKRLRVNRQATDAWLAALKHNKNDDRLFGDDLVGNVVILTGAEILEAQ